MSPWNTSVLVIGLLLAGCAGEPGPEVVSASEISTVEQNAAIEGRDGGASAVAFGRSVWIYGDTVITVADDHGHNWHHNSISWTSDLDARDGITGFTEPLEDSGAPRHFIPPSPTELEFNLAHYGDDCAEQPCGARWAIWPGHPVWDAANERALVSYTLIYAEPGDFNFHSVGASFAIWDELGTPPQRPVVDPTAEHPDLLWLEGEPGFGVGSLIDGDYLYSFSCDEPGGGHPCKLARVLLTEVTVRSAWDYFDGEGWSPDLADARTLFEAAPIMSCAFNSHLNQWMVVYTPPFDHEIVARTASELTGPWSAPSVLYVAPEEDPPYDALWHPEYDLEGGKTIYVTYSRHTSGWFGAEFPLVEINLGDAVMSE